MKRGVGRVMCAVVCKPGNVAMGGGASSSSPSSLPLLLSLALSVRVRSMLEQW